MKRAPALLLLGLLGGCAHAPQTPQAPVAQPAIQVRVYPASFRVAPLRGDEVTVMVLVPPGTPFWCPKIEVDWGVPGQAPSSHEEDCDPEQAGQGYSYMFRGSPKMVYIGGTIIRVRLSQGQQEATFGGALRVVGER